MPRVCRSVAWIPSLITGRILRRLQFLSAAAARLHGLFGVVAYCTLVNCGGFFLFFVALLHKSVNQGSRTCFVGHGLSVERMIVFRVACVRESECSERCAGSSVAVAKGVQVIRKRTGGLPRSRW